MLNLKKQEKSQTKKAKFKKLVPLYAFLLAFSIPQFAFATDGTTQPSLQMNFDVTQMFSWTQTIINALMPVVYVTLGISLGFLIIRALKSAFN